MHSPMHSSSVIKNLAAEDWRTLALLMNKIDLSDIKNKKSRRKILLVKSILNVHLSTLNGGGTIHARLLIGALKTAATLEKDLGDSEHYFLLFMKALICKFEGQRLLVDKVMEKRLEFKKMKGVIDS